MTETSHSQRRACALVGMDPKTYRYESRRPDDAGIRKRLRELAEQRRRFGYRRLHILLAREGIRLNHKKLYRIYREERLTVRKRGGRKRALGTRAPLLLPWNRNQRWSLDFLADALADGRRFRILAVVDDFSRECLALVVDTSLSGVRVARELDRIVELRGRPRMLVSDNGTELTSNAILPGNRNAALAGTTSHRVSPCKTALSRASTAACATSASTNISSPAWPKRGGSSRNGGTTTTQHARTRAWMGSHPTSLQPAPIGAIT